MKSSDVGVLFGRLFIVSCWLLWKMLALTARYLVMAVMSALPRAGSRNDAVRCVAVVGCASLLVLGMLLLVFGTSSLFLLAGAMAMGISGMTSWALLRCGWAEVALGTGGVTVGQKAGPLGVPIPYVIPRESRVRHMAVFGPTGSGKSTVLKHLVWQDVDAPGSHGLLCIDVKDDLVLDIAAQASVRRRAEVVLFDPADAAFPPAFNPLFSVPPEGRTLAAAEMLSALKRLYGDFWGPRLEHVLRAVLLTLLETPQATLLDIVRLLTDAGYRAWAVQHVTNFTVRAFWEHEFSAIVGSRGSLANVESILNKLGVLAYPEVRNVLGQTRRGLDLRAAMDGGQIVLAHLPQGVLGEDASHFLAALLVGKVQLAAQSRVTTPMASRRPFYLYADEFQNYETSALTKLITEGRSMGVGLVAACQFPEQLPAHLRLAVERNCAHALHCRVRDGRYAIDVVKLQERDSGNAVIQVRPAPPGRQRGTTQLAAIRARSRELLARPRGEIERAIAQRMTRPTKPSVMNERQSSGSQGNGWKSEGGYGRYFE